jgi:hypothetical protein
LIIYILYKILSSCSNRKRRANSGGEQKLTLEKAKEIREKYKAGLGNQYQLAKEFKVSQALVSLIILGRRWGEIYEEKETSQ